MLSPWPTYNLTLHFNNTCLIFWWPTAILSICIHDDIVVIIDDQDKEEMHEKATDHAKLLTYYFLNILDDASTFPTFLKRYSPSLAIDRTVHLTIS